MLAVVLSYCYLVIYLFIKLSIIMKKITSVHDLSHNLYYERDFDSSSLREFLDSLSYCAAFVNRVSTLSFYKDEESGVTCEDGKEYWLVIFRFLDDTTFALVCHTPYVFRTYLPLLRKMYVSEEHSTFMFNFKPL